MNKMFENFKTMLGEISDDEKLELRTLMGITTPLKGTVSKTRITGKFIRTEKVYENNLNKQMSVLIKSLPSDREVDVTEWSKLSIENGLETQQDPVRIVTYYKKNLVEMGFVKQI